MLTPRPCAGQPQLQPAALKGRRARAQGRHAAQPQPGQHSCPIFQETSPGEHRVCLYTSHEYVRVSVRELPVLSLPSRPAFQGCCPKAVCLLPMLVSHRAKSHRQNRYPPSAALARCGAHARVAHTLPGTRVSNSYLPHGTPHTAALPSPGPPTWAQGPAVRAQ